MEKQKYIDDIQEIKEIMQRSSKFISLSGLSGILAGVFALIAAYLAYDTIYSGQDYLAYRRADLTCSSLIQLISIALGTIFLSVSCGIYLTTRKARRLNQSIFDRQARLLVSSMSIPLISGGVVCLILLVKGYLALLAPLTLIFYGLALVNASKYAVESMRNLGLVEIGLGLISMWFLGYGLIFWVLGFGVMHIAYGIVMYLNDKV